MSCWKLLIVDASYLIHRGAKSKILDADKAHHKGLYLLWKTIHLKIDEIQPTHVCTALDGRYSTKFRKRIYPNYKANRYEIDETIIWQLQNVEAFCNAIGIQSFIHEKYEADDIIHTYVNKALQEEFEQIHIISIDKDLFPLLNDNRVYIHRRDKPLNIANPSTDIIDLDNFRVRPSQIQDFLALAGDASDNIPGCRGIGCKRAKILLDSYGNLDEIFANIDGIIADKKKTKKFSKIYELLKEEKEVIIEQYRKVIELYDVSENNEDFISLEKCKVDMNALYAKYKREWLNDNDMSQVALEIEEYQESCYQYK